MRPLKPKQLDSEDISLTVNKTTLSILEEYEKYTGYSKSEIVDHLVKEIMVDDTEFVEWLKTKRFNKRAQKNILNADIANEGSNS